MINSNIREPEGIREVKEFKRHEANPREQNISINVDELRTTVSKERLILAAATAHLEYLENERRKEEKVDKEKVSEFESYVHAIYAAHVGTRGEMMNRIFEDNHIVPLERGFEMRQMATAIKHVLIKEYKDKNILEMMNSVDQWIRDANELRVANKSGGKIHPTKIGHCKYIWHILYFEEDFKKQQDDLSNRFQSAGQTLQNRIDEYTELEQVKKQEETIQEPEEMVMNNGGQIVGGE